MDAPLYVPYSCHLNSQIFFQTFLWIDIHFVKLWHDLHKVSNWKGLVINRVAHSLKRLKRGQLEKLSKWINSALQPTCFKTCTPANSLRDLTCAFPSHSPTLWFCFPAFPFSMGMIFFYKVALLILVCFVMTVSLENFQDLRYWIAMIFEQKWVKSTDYGCRMKPFFIEIQNFCAWAEKLGR